MAFVNIVHAGYIITTIAGNGTPGFSGDLGGATSAQLNLPSSVAVDASGNVYIADTGNNVIRKVNTSGIISTFAGGGSSGLGDGGLATSAELNRPYGVAVDTSGDVYIVDTNNDRIREVNTSGIISTFAGGGSIFVDGCSATSAHLFESYGIAVDTSGDVYIAEKNTNRIRKVNTSGIISTFAGGGSSGLGDEGPATSAQLNQPCGIAVDASGNVYIADIWNYRIRKVNTSGIISTFAGGGSSGLGDGGPATSAQLNQPYGIAVDASGNVYITDFGNYRIRVVNSSGIILTFAGNGYPGFSGDGGSATSAQLNLPYSVAVDASGDVYIADMDNNRIRKVFFVQTGTISGKVTKSDGTTVIPGAIVLAMQNGITTTQTISDSYGNYSLQIATGIYNITASSTGYVTQTQSNQVVTNGQSITVNFALTATFGFVSGKVMKTDETTAITGAVILALQNGTTTAQTISDNSGNYSIQLATGTYNITAFLTGYVTQTQSGQVVTSGQTTTVNFALLATPTIQQSTGTIAGKVTKSDGTTAIPGAIIRALQNGTTVTQTISDSSGNYSMQIATGTYNITISSTGYVTQSKQDRL